MSQRGNEDTGYDNNNNDNNASACSPHSDVLELFQEIHSGRGHSTFSLEVRKSTIPESGNGAYKQWKNR